MAAMLPNYIARTSAVVRINGPVVLPRMLEQNPAVVQAWRDSRQIERPIRRDVFSLDVE